MHVLCCQYDIAWHDKQANYAKIESLVTAAAPPKGALVVLPEMSCTGFSMAVSEIAEPAGGPTEQFLSSFARRFGIFLAGGIVGRGSDGSGRNELVAFSPNGSLLTRYAKMQPFTLGDEANNYAAGETVATFQCGECLVAPFICYDLRFPEIFRIAARERPQLFVVIANWPDARLAHWVRLLQARAIENQAYVLGVNRCGADPRWHYSGRSLVADPHGEIIADAGSTEGTATAVLDLKFLEKYRRDLPFLADMRADCVKPLPG